ncbi:MAG: ATP-binding cassette domain-containing protein [Pseudomonadota bacterium]|nr:ATP-binding cassette domain-containing protein [Pseudomonadota bacterium]
MRAQDVPTAVPDGRAEVPKIRVSAARKTFRQKNGAEVEAISDLSFAVADGEYVAIVGPTGAGKSVLLDCLLGLKTLDAGRIEIDGQEVDHYIRSRKGRITRIFQEDRLLPWLSATDNAALGLQIQGMPEKERRERAAYWLDAVGLSRFRNAFPSELSGGMRQRVNIARAFAPNPEIILLDEAFSALDEITAARLRGDFRDLAHRQKMTYVIVTHSIEEAIFLGSRILVFGVPARLVREVVVPAGASQDRAVVDRIRDEIRASIAGAGRRD